jgi:hypothetical protein
MTGIILVTSKEKGYNENAKFYRSFTKGAKNEKNGQKKNFFFP